MNLSKKMLQRSALLLMDFQVDVCAEGGRMVTQTPEVLMPFKETIDRAAKLLSTARASAMAPHIIHINHLFRSGYPELAGGNLSPMDGCVMGVNAFVEGERGADVVPELAPLESEYLIKKKTLSPFASTELGMWLRKRDINTVILTGVVTHYVVLATAFYAYDMGLSVVVVKDCCMSGTPESHQAALDVMGPLATIVESSDLMSLMN